MLISGWNVEKVTLLAPDVAAAKTARKLALPQKWVSLGHDEYSAWGEYQGSGRLPYQVKLDLLRLSKGESGHHCTCPSHKQPCKHVLGLLFLVVEQPQNIAIAPPPAFVQEWLDKVAQRTRKELEKKKAGPRQPDQDQQAKTQTERLERIRQGLQDLDLWLINLLRHGLANSQLRQYQLWDNRAARLVDAQAPGVAGWLREIGSLAALGSEGMEKLLQACGRVYLLCQSVPRYDTLPEPIQADLRVALGWPTRREEVADTPGLWDRWLVIGRHTETLDKRLRSQRLWLRGESSQQDALILDFAFADAPFETQFLPGETIQAELCYFPSQYPLRAFIKQMTPQSQTPIIWQGATIRASLQQYALALARNPWLIQFPFLLSGVIPLYLNNRLILREPDGTYLPVQPGFPHKWSLMALSGGHPLAMAGEWNGETLKPVGVLTEGRLIDFTLLEQLA